MSTTTRVSPYQVVFGQSQRTNNTELEILFQLGITNEKDVKEFLQDTEGGTLLKASVNGSGVDARPPSQPTKDGPGTTGQDKHEKVRVLATKK